MQAELDTTATARPIRIFGVNGIGQESGNPVICAGRTLPWLQDSTQVGVWASWAVTYRDVVLLDAANLRFGVYNLTVHDLSNPANYAELKSLLLAAAH